LARALSEARLAQDDTLARLSDDERQSFVGLLRKATDAANDQSRAPLRLIDAEAE